mmetsp:Transcript_10868/g.21630  ORF Transcript_10868/g.21630 Transcript_10868/m.21630 type:complete len:248 (+) Transcript_10868:2340-3083(+)
MTLVSRGRPLECWIGHSSIRPAGSTNSMVFLRSFKHTKLASSSHFIHRKSKTGGLSSLRWNIGVYIHKLFALRKGKTLCILVAKPPDSPEIITSPNRHSLHMHSSKIRSLWRPLNKWRLCPEGSVLDFLWILLSNIIKQHLCLIPISNSKLIATASIPHPVIQISSWLIRLLGRLLVLVWNVVQPLQIIKQNSNKPVILIKLVPIQCHSSSPCLIVVFILHKGKSFRKTCALIHWMIQSILGNGPTC